MRLIVLLITLHFFSCNSSTNEELSFENFNFPSDCCSSVTSMKVLEGQVDSSEIRVYLANIINPRFSGFHVNGNIFPEGIFPTDNIELFQIRDLNDKLIYENSNFTPNNIGHGWDGRSNNDDVEGAFTSTIRFRTIDRSLIEIKSIFCSMFCDGNLEEYLNQGFNFTDCMWPSQYNGNGEFCATCEGSESECF